MREGVAREALRLAGAHEADEGVGHDGEVDELRGCDLLRAFRISTTFFFCFCFECRMVVPGRMRSTGRGTYQIDEPLQNNGSAIRHLQEAEQRDQQHDQDAVNGDAVARAARQKARRLALEREAEETAAGAVDVAVARAEGGRKHHRIDDIRQDMDLQPIHRHDIRTRRRTWQASRKRIGELLIRIGDIDADRQAAQDEKRREPVEDGIIGARHDDARVLGLARRHADIVGPGDGEAGLDEALQEAEEAAEGAGLVELGECAGVAPVAEAEAVVQRVAAEHGHEGVEDQADDQDHFAEREPELGFAVPFYGEDVD